MACNAVGDVIRPVGYDLGCGRSQWHGGSKRIGWAGRVGRGGGGNSVSAGHPLDVARWTRSPCIAALATDTHLGSHGGPGHHALQH